MQGANWGLKTLIWNPYWISINIFFFIKFEPKKWRKNPTMGGNLVYSSFSFRRKSDYIAGFPGGNYYAANTDIQHRYSWHYDTAIKIYTHHIHIHSQIRFGLYLLKILLEIAEFQVGKMSKINRADIYFANLTIRLNKLLLFG